MKPSDRINELFFEVAEEAMDADRATLMAVIKYLDEQWEKDNGISSGTTCPKCGKSDDDGPRCS